MGERARVGMGINDSGEWLMSTTKSKKEAKPKKEAEDKPAPKPKEKAKKPAPYITIGEDALSDKDVAFINKLAIRMKTDPSGVAAAFVRMAAFEGGRRGVGFYAPRVKRFSR